MKYYLTIENEDGEVVLETTSSSFEIIEEQVGAFQRMKLCD